ncbi:hypothetical protein BDQ17DRAFT_1240714 [Cyathus striatus]|nr:hypothetical protein BDQ17DRAFT_1240714 [Cyathus striatus]
MFSSPCSLFNVSHPGGVYNTPRSALDLYTPRFVRGKGVDKLGLCPICIEPLHRGGDNKRVWLAMKFSAYNYHMQYAHGVSSSTGRPFFPPLSVRVVDRSSPKKNEKKTMQEGKCHQCRKWVSMQGVKDVDVKVKELFWWKHAAACHRDAGIVGEQDFYEIDHVWKQLKKLKVV